MSARPHEVDELPDVAFTVPASWAAAQLRDLGHAAVEVAPGDTTMYRLTIVDAERGVMREDQVARSGSGAMMGGGRFLVASTFGRLYAWSGNPIHWDYVAEHYVTDHSEWTARVIARFLTTLSNIMNGAPA